MSKKIIGWIIMVVVISGLLGCAFYYDVEATFYMLKVLFIAMIIAAILAYALRLILE